MSTSDGVEASGERPVRRIARVVTWVIYVYVVIVEVVLLIGFVCLLVGVEPSNWLAEWIYRSVDRAMGPYRGVFDSIEYGENGEVDSVVESSIPFAMMVYGIIALAAHDLLEWLGRPRRA